MKITYLIWPLIKYAPTIEILISPCFESTGAVLKTQLFR